MDKDIYIDNDEIRINYSTSQFTINQINIDWVQFRFRFLCHVQMYFRKFIFKENKFQVIKQSH